MRVCVISDLHCKFKKDLDDRSETFLFSNAPRKPINHHPVVALLDLISKQSINCDYLVCPGDLGDKADEQGITSSWQFLEEINTKLHSKLILGIPGNHDVNSRLTGGKGSFEFIQAFHERFPVEDENAKNCFWQNGFCFVKNEKALFLLINTVTTHTDADKAQYAEIKIDTLSKIENSFKDNKEFQDCDFKLAILHHHPLHYSDIKNWKDTDLANNSDKLLSLLNLLNFQIVIHGHKHQPRLTEVNSLPIFAAGSFSSFSNLQGTGINTMFHIVELSSNEKRGNIYSWEFDFANGWTQKLNEKFPPAVGFGSTLTEDQIADKIHSTFIKNGGTPMLFDEILAEISDIKFTVPETLIKVKNILQAKYQIATSPEFPIEPYKISLTKN